MEHRNRNLTTEKTIQIRHLWLRLNFELQAHVCRRCVSSAPNWVSSWLWCRCLRPLNRYALWIQFVFQDSGCFLFKGHKMQRILYQKSCLKTMKTPAHQAQSTKVPSLLDRLLSLVACFGIDLWKIREQNNPYTVHNICQHFVPGYRVKLSNTQKMTAWRAWTGWLSGGGASLASFFSWQIWKRTRRHPLVVQKAFCETFFFVVFGSSDLWIFDVIAQLWSKQKVNLSRNLGKNSIILTTGHTQKSPRRSAARCPWKVCRAGSEASHICDINVLLHRRSASPLLGTICVVAFHKRALLLFSLCSSRSLEDQRLRRLRLGWKMSKERAEQSSKEINSHKHSTMCVLCVYAYIHVNMACVQYQITSTRFKLDFIFQHARQNQNRCGKEHRNGQHNWGIVPGEALLPSLASAEQSADLRWTMRSRDRRISRLHYTWGSSRLLNHLANLSKTSHTWITVIK